MSAPKEKAARPARVKAAQIYNNVRSNTSQATMQTQGRRLPAYGRDLIALQRRGFNVPYLVLALDWTLYPALPRVVVPPGTHAAELDLSLVAGMDCLVSHRDELGRALDVAELAIDSGATLCLVRCAATGLKVYTAEVLAARKAAA